MAVGGVDEVHAELRRPPQCRQCGSAVGRRAPDAGTGETHRAEAEPVDGDVSDRELTGGRRVDRTHDEMLLIHLCDTAVRAIWCSSRMRAAARSPMITQGAIVLPVVTRGMIDASAIRRLSMP